MNKNLKTDLGALLKQALEDQLLDTTIKIKIDLNRIRFTEKVCATNNANPAIEFPSKILREEYLNNGTEDLWLAGFENDGNGKGNGRLNFILSDGKRTHQKSDADMTEHMMFAKGKLVKIIQIFTSVTNRVNGFKFFDKYHQFIFLIGQPGDSFKETIIEDDE